ncbi:MAG: SDR family oxidoreductase [Candidatus Omnitrophota bacterium]|jgi:hypothetical protein
MKRSVKGMTVLITGATGGLGRAFARAFADEGANLILTGRSRQQLEELSGALRLNRQIRVDTEELDLALPGVPGRLFEKVREKGLSADILVNNAGFGWCGRFEASDPARNAELVTVNVTALTALARLFLPGMLERKRGGLIQVASTAAFQPMPYMSLYAASKAFVLSFTEALWGEYQPAGLRVLCVCPGHTETAFHTTAGILGREVFLLASPESAVRTAMKAFLRGSSPTVVCGTRNYLLSLGYRLLPRRWLVGITRNFFDRRR